MINIPNDWERKTLNDIGVFSKGSGISSEQLKDAGIPCVGYGDLYTKYDTMFCVPQNFIDKKAAKMSVAVNKGTLLFTATGETAEEIGKCVCYYGEEIIYVGGDIFILRTKDINPLFVAYQQNSFQFIKQKARLGQGHSVVHIRMEDIKKLLVVCPKSIKEQQKIAKILTKWDDAIELQKQLIENLELQKTVLMQKLLTPKKDWSKNKLNTLIENWADGATPSRKDVSNFGNSYWWIVIEDIKRYITTTKEKLSKQGLKNSSCVVWPPDTIILSTGATIGEVGILKVSATTKQGIIGIIVKPNLIDGEFLRYWFIFNKQRLINLSQGISIKEVRIDKLAKLDIYLPKKLSEQKKISNVLVTMDNIINLHSQKLDLLKCQRKALMQRLLTGAIRVKV